MTPADPYNVPVVRYRWMFPILVVLWAALVILGILNLIRHFRDHVPFDLTFWVGTALLVVIAAMLIRANRIRRNARSGAASDRTSN